MSCQQENKESLYSFDDIIDGYFPLKFSLLQLLDRLNSSLAYVEISHAPIMEIYELEPQDPVFDSMIRLAEPAYVQGFCSCIGRGSQSSKMAESVFRNKLPESSAIWGPFRGNFS